MPKQQLSAASYQRHEHGRDVEAAIKATRAAAAKACGGKDGLLVVHADSAGVQWTREWQAEIEAIAKQPNAEASPAKMKEGEVS